MKTSCRLKSGEGRNLAVLQRVEAFLVGERASRGGAIKYIGYVYD